MAAMVGPLKSRAHECAHVEVWHELGTLARALHPAASALVHAPSSPVTSPAAESKVSIDLGGNVTDFAPADVYCKGKPETIHHVAAKAERRNSSLIRTGRSGGRQSPS